MLLLTLAALEQWMLCGEGNERVEAVGKAAPKCMEVLYEADILEEDVCLQWWKGRCAAKRAVQEARPLVVVFSLFRTRITVCCDY